MKFVQVFCSNAIEIQPVYDRWYRLSKSVTIAIKLKSGIWLIYKFRAGFLFDGRSGGPLADFFVPNLGTQKELICWLIHDANGYALALSFDDTNELLRQMLIWAGHGRVKASIVKGAVSISDSWFGEPKPGDREYENVNPVPMFDVDESDSCAIAYSDQRMLL